MNRDVCEHFNPVPCDKCKAEPVEPVEPVAWMVTDCIGERDLCFSPPLDNDQVLPLYAAPPQRKPLSEAKIKKLLIESAGMTVKFSDVDLRFARAIERAHGIGGEA